MGRVRGACTRQRNSGGTISMCRKLIADYVEAGGVLPGAVDEDNCWFRIEGRHLELSTQHEVPIEGLRCLFSASQIFEHAWTYRSP